MYVCPGSGVKVLVGQHFVFRGIGDVGGVSRFFVLGKDGFILPVILRAVAHHLFRLSRHGHRTGYDSEEGFPLVTGFVFRKQAQAALFVAGQQQVHAVRWDDLEKLAFRTDGPQL